MSASSKQISIVVKAGGSTYPVCIGRRLDQTLIAAVRRSTDGGRVFAVFDATFYALHGRYMERTLARASRHVVTSVIPSGEKSKSVETVNRLHDLFLSEGVTRDDLILACGGGVTSDLVGYAAATILRGVSWGICATTLLSMVDASIGGKTGVNHPRGKNLIGAFWQPSFVISDLDWLATLDDRQMSNGMGEIIKTAGLLGGGLLKEVGLLVRSEGKLEATSKSLYRAVATAIRYKARIVSRDERDRGARQWLNYGHTFAHAVEQSLGYRRLAHGEAVILGILGALDLAYRTNIADRRAMATYHETVRLAAHRLPWVSLHAEGISAAMATDKKRGATGLRFVLLKRPGQPILISDVAPSLVRKSIETMIEQYREK
jgi:3-dehydroquinate synthase